MLVRRYVRSSMPVFGLGFEGMNLAPRPPQPCIFEKNTEKNTECQKKNKQDYESKAPVKKYKAAEDQIQILKVTRNALSTVSIHAHVWTAKLQSGLNPSKLQKKSLARYAAMRLGQVFGTT